MNRVLWTNRPGSATVDGRPWQDGSIVRPVRVRRRAEQIPGSRWGRGNRTFGQRRAPQPVLRVNSRPEDQYESGHQHDQALHRLQSTLSTQCRSINSPLPTAIARPTPNGQIPQNVPSTECLLGSSGLDQRQSLGVIRTALRPGAEGPDARTLLLGRNSAGRRCLHTLRRDPSRSQGPGRIRVRFRRRARRA
jgi:hypothetical protein